MVHPSPGLRFLSLVRLKEPQKIPIRWLVLLAALGSCKKAPAPPSPPPSVRTVTLRPRSVEQSQEWLATLDGSTNAEIRPQVNGYVQSVNYEEGSTVDVGSLLFTIDRRAFLAAVEKAEGEYESTSAQLKKARLDVQRYTPLVAEHAISRQELDDALAAEQGSEANVQAMKGALDAAKLNLHWTEVQSPIRGLAGIAQTRVGNLVNPNMVLTVVSTIDPIRASIHISEREYLAYAHALNNANDPQYAKQRYLELILINGQVHSHGARRVIVDRQIDPSTGTLLVQALFPNPNHILRPGMFAKLRVHTGVQENTLVVPEIAVKELQGQYQVALVGKAERVEMRTVKLGRLLDHEYIVEGGLTAGERVIVGGLQKAEPGAKVTAREEPTKPTSARRAEHGATAPIRTGS